MVFGIHNKTKAYSINVIRHRKVPQWRGGSQYAIANQIQIGIRLKHIFIIKMDIIVFYIVIGWAYEFPDVVPSIIVLYIIIGLVPTPRHGTLPVD